jgi:hypothetical protein
MSCWIILLFQYHVPQVGMHILKNRRVPESWLSTPSWALPRKPVLEKMQRVFSRVMTWTHARGTGNSGGQNGRSSLHSWTDSNNVADYKIFFFFDMGSYFSIEAMSNFFQEFPELENCDLYFAVSNSNQLHCTWLNLFVCSNPQSTSWCPILYFLHDALDWVQRAGRMAV